MKKKSLIFLLLILLNLFISGCTAKTPIAPVSNKISFDTGVGVQNVVALPVAIEGQPYSVTIAPLGGNAPYVCASVPAESFIIGSIRLTENCTIVGTAPMLSPGTTHGIYPVKFTITDANGVLSGPFDLALEVIKGGAQGQGAAAGGPSRFVAEDGCPSPFDGKWTGHLTSDFLYINEVGDVNHGFKKVPQSTTSISFDVSFTLKCLDVFKESDGYHLYGGIIMEVTDFTATYPDFKCEQGCSSWTMGSMTYPDPKTGNQVPAIMITFGEAPDTYSFDTTTFDIQVPGDPYYNSISIRPPERAFSSVNTISNTYSWQRSNPGEITQNDIFAWDIVSHGVNIMCSYDNSYQGSELAVISTRCERVTNSYVLNKVG